MAIDNEHIGQNIPGKGKFTELTVSGAFTFPGVDGTDGQVMKTDGAGVITWQDDEMLNLSFALPTTDGTNGQVMKTDGAGVASWQDDNDGLTDLPFALPNVDGTANQVMKTNGSGVITWQDDDKLSLPFALPTTDGTVGQVIKTDGAGVTSWQDDINTDTAGDLTFTFPTNNGTPGQTMTTDGLGGSSWKDSSAGEEPTNWTNLTVFGPSSELFTNRSIAGNTTGTSIKISEDSFIVASNGEASKEFLSLIKVLGSDFAIMNEELNPLTFGDTFLELKKFTDNSFITASDNRVQIVDIVDSKFVFNSELIFRPAGPGGAFNIFVLSDTRFVMFYSKTGSQRFFGLFSVDGSKNIMQLDELEFFGDGNILVGTETISDTKFIFNYRTNTAPRDFIVQIGEATGDVLSLGSEVIFQSGISSPLDTSMKLVKTNEVAMTYRKVSPDADPLRIVVVPINVTTATPNLGTELSLNDTSNFTASSAVGSVFNSENDELLIFSELRELSLAINVFRAFIIDTSSTYFKKIEVHLPSVNNSSDSMPFGDGKSLLSLDSLGSGIISARVIRTK